MIFFFFVIGIGEEVKGKEKFTLNREKISYPRLLKLMKTTSWVKMEKEPLAKKFGATCRI